MIRICIFFVGLVLFTSCNNNDKMPDGILDFYNSYDYYKSNTPLFKKILDSMIIQAEQKKNIKTQTVVEK